jgi:hypothetical protein
MRSKNNSHLQMTGLRCYGSKVDHSTLPGYSAARAVGIDASSTNVWRTSGVCVRRGVYELGGTTLRCGDPFGIWTVDIFLPEKSMLVVMPPVISLPSVQITPGGWMGDGRPRPNISIKPECGIRRACTRR